jgi:hypothetical protein
MLNAFRTAHTDLPFARVYLWAGLALFTGLDVATGRIIHFPIFCTMPIAVAAWFGYPWLAAGSCAALAAFRGTLEWLFWRSDPGFGVVALNGVVRFVLLLALSLLVYHVGSSVRAMVRKVKLLEGILPICSYCKQIRDDGHVWHSLEAYMASHSNTHFSHGICPACMDKHFSTVDGLASR